MLSGKWLSGDHLMLLRLQLFKPNPKSKSHVKERKSQFKGNVHVRKKNLEDGCPKRTGRRLHSGELRAEERQKQDKKVLKKTTKKTCYK